MLNELRSNTESSEAGSAKVSTFAYKLGFARYVIVSSIAPILIIFGFLTFLWFADYQNRNRRPVVLSDWTTRAVSIPSLIIRQAVSAGKYWCCHVSCASD